MHRAASAYPDARILHAWDERRQRVVYTADSDTLGQFIARELYETFDPKTTDARQISTAVGAMRHAADSMLDVMQALNGLSTQRSSSKRLAA